ncbi:sulfatase [Rubripirellula sp.]|nr:sulfatase [Rubripirellula sp.]MDB4654683.1 sulfatase [Rubripirellula sp.]
MNYNTAHRCLYCLAIASSLIATASAKERPAKPNVVLILTDDLGWQDVKCYDIDAPSPMETPNIDALSKQGVMFWQAYAPAPTCAPSRCAIMSGVHPARAQKTHVVGGNPPRSHHKTAHPMMPPWYSGRMPENEFTLAKALQKEGYTTGHAGKWHMAIQHNAYPDAKDQGFDWSRSSRGARSSMKPNRISNFATKRKNDPYHLDANGFPFHQNSEDALTFLNENHDKPFFLYYATWLVHAPIHTRSKQLLDKYCEKLGVQPDKDQPEAWKGKGQTNPFYCAMVEELDYYLGKIFNYLNQTEDPRWPGHKLNENTYLIFTSDNGGMEGHPGEIYTDNYPLDRGKISLMEGGTRVPLIITGPTIPKGVQTDVMVNGLDFYPTILSWVHAKPAKDKQLDGADLSQLLSKNPSDASLVTDTNGKRRDTMVWHFPNGVALESTIRIGDYKLVRNYNHARDPRAIPLELYRLYQNVNGKQVRVDIEEAKNLVDAEPSRTSEMNDELSLRLEKMKASYPYNNPAFRNAGRNGKLVPTVTSHKRNGRNVKFTFKENGAKVIQANLIYSRNGNDRNEEWFRKKATLDSKNTVITDLPEGTTHYILNLIDKNNFLVSYPDIPGGNHFNKTKEKFAKYSIAVDEEN